jgi:hypothetical protein
LHPLEKRRLVTAHVEIGPSSVLGFGHLMEPKPTFGDDGFSPRPRVTLAAKGYRRM